MKPVLIGIYKEIYDITKYIPKHPGEGIRFVNLRQYNKKDATEDFDRHHMTNEPDEMLIKAKEEGFDEETGIYYVCPFFNFSIKNNIPSYFYFLPNDPYAIKFMEDKEDMTYILRPSNSDRSNSLSITYKNDGIHQLKIRLIDKQKWHVEWENEDGEPEDIVKSNVTELIEYIFSEDYSPIIQ